MHIPPYSINKITQDKIMIRLIKLQIKFIGLMNSQLTINEKIYVLRD